jgi:3-deoxy-D-manno-octulosonic-acid transferase
MFTQQKKYGWYSSKAAEDFGTIIYEKNNGEKVEVTYVSTDPQDKSYLWFDAVSVGEVVKYIGQGRSNFEFKYQLKCM